VTGFLAIALGLVTGFWIFFLGVGFGWEVVAEGVEFGGGFGAVYVSFFPQPQKAQAQRQESYQ